MSRYIEYEPLMAELEREVELADDWKTAHEIANVVKYAPSIDIPQWIPCGERLPRGDAQVLVSVSVADAPWSIILMSASSVGEYYRRGHIDAWMPLPKPYGEREDE